MPGQRLLTVGSPSYRPSHCFVCHGSGLLLVSCVEGGVMTGRLLWTIGSPSPPLIPELFFPVLVKLLLLKILSVYIGCII